MKIHGTNIDETIATIKTQLEEDRTISPLLKDAIEMLMLVTTALLNQLGLNSKNSSKPPSSDQKTNKENKTQSGAKKKGGQKGHVGSTLMASENPDVVEFIPYDRRLLPEGDHFQVGVEKRQVFDIEFNTVVTEYQAQILQNKNGDRFVAPFPDGVTHFVQYGVNVKAHAVYLSQYQLLPYERIREYFADQLQLPLSAGTLFNFNTQALEKLEQTKALDIIKTKLIGSPALHVDETGMNVNGNRHWLHTASTPQWTFLFPHVKRGKEAMDAAEILPNYLGVLIHDHWKPYFKYPCRHSLCNSHHLRELERAAEQDGFVFAKEMQDFLLETNKEVEESGGRLPYKKVKERLLAYRAILNKAQIECPAPPPKKKGKKGRVAKSKSRNLLERLIDYETEVLRFMVNLEVAFTNNLAERDIRMTKVHQKISGCFRSESGAEIFCGVRSYLSSCRKQGISASTALQLLFSGHLPDIFKAE